MDRNTAIERQRFRVEILVAQPPKMGMLGL